MILPRPVTCRRADFRHDVPQHCAGLVGRDHRVFAPLAVRLYRRSAS